MPRPAPDSAKLDRAAELYLSGKTFKEAGAEVGLHSDTVRIFLARRGIKARPRSQRPANNRISPPDDLFVGAYLGGESEKDLAARYGVSRPVMKRWLDAAGIQRRTLREASLLHQATLSPERRQEKLAAAHAAARGRVHTEEERAKAALTRELRGDGGHTSSGTEYLCDQLDARGVSYTREKAVGRYNVDVALSAYPIAVEVLGGNWHGAKAIHARRTPYILDRGWNMVFLWHTRRCKISAAAVDQVMALTEIASVDPAEVRQYWVLRGDGKIDAVGRADDDEFALVPPSEAGLKPRTAYGRRS